MQLIIITKRKTSASKLSFGPYWIFCCSALFAAMLCVTFYAGAYFSLEYSTNTVAVKYQKVKQVLQAELGKQHMLIEDARKEAQENLDILAARLSKLQGHIMRLDALGARLASMANLDDIDFNVTEPPGMGGPKLFKHTRSLNVPDFLTQLEQLGEEIDDRNDKLTAMETMLMDTNLHNKTLPDTMPINSGWISSLFGWRTDPITGKREFHEGVDFASKPKTLVRAVAAGIVTWSDRHSGYGIMIEINHGNGYVTRYAHNKKNLVVVGDRVEKGQPIAEIGSSGRSTGTHVHFEVVHNGEHVDPKKYISVN
jgi:murein DD-endopeptidase MepM/ murein hydrolase activator NlpD